MEKSNGYEKIASEFIKIRGPIGSLTVKHWAETLPHASIILDLGCGSGVPISKTLIGQGFRVFGIDASPTLAAEFRKNFPNNSIRCESVQNSSFYNMQFDAIVAWGLLFLLPGQEQILLIKKISSHLNLGGKILFTSPQQKVSWKDVMTGLYSQSLGAEKYRDVLKLNGFKMLEEFTDEGENFYYSAVKI